MEELFRFSVVRPVTKSDPTTAPLASPPTNQIGRINSGAGFQQQVISVVASLAGDNVDNETIWARIEFLAAQYLVAAGMATAANTLWAETAAFLSDLQGLSDTSGTSEVDQAAVAGVFAKHPSLTAQALGAYRPALADLFLALMIVQRGGPTRLEVLAQNPTLRAIVPFVGARATLAAVTQSIVASDIALAGPSAIAPAPGLTAAQSRAALEASINGKLSATWIVPPGLFTPLKRPTLGVGFREFNVVKQHIRRYNKAEIARIDNILKGETRDHWTRHSLSTETDSVFSQTTTTETDKELDTNDHTSIQSQAQDQINTDTKLTSGVHASYSGPSYKIQADLGVSYDKADAKTQSYSTDTAKDITKKSVSNVTDVVTRTQTTKVIEAYLDREHQSFNNVGGAGNISGVYQWIEKVYLSQVFNLGRHMLIDVTVPEPAANLLAMATVTSVESPPPVEPQPLGTIQRDGSGAPILDRYGRMQLVTPLNPLDLGPTRFDATTGAIDPNFYGNWVGLYGASGVSPPPESAHTYSTTKTFAYKDDNDPQDTDEIDIDDGYGAYAALVTVNAMRNDNPDGGNSVTTDNVYVNVSIGGTSLHLPWFTDQGQLSQARTLTLQGKAVFATPLTGSVQFFIYGHNIDQMDVSVELIADPSQYLMDQWRLQTYEKIVGAYQGLLTNYNAAIADQKFATNSVGPLGSDDEDINRQTEQVELKRACIAIFDGSPGIVAGRSTPIVLDPSAQVISPSSPLNPDDPQLPVPDVQASQIFGSRVRWFEEAFEWENMAYILYPYYWGRRARWIPNFELTNGDNIFLQFLQAGYARVVVPVRLGFEPAVQFFLNTGLPWLGGDLPPVGDNTQNPLYLDVAEEIKALTGGGEPGEVETPVGDPWEYVLPTTLMQLNDLDQLPEWHREAPAGDSGSEWSSDAPDDDWTWKDGAPPST